MIFILGFQIPGCEHNVDQVGESGPRARWVPAGGPLGARWLPKMTFNFRQQFALGKVGVGGKERHF